MKYLYATLIGIALVVGGMFLPSLVTAQPSGATMVCRADSSKATLKQEFPDGNIDMDKTLAIMFVNVLAKKGQTPPPGLTDKIGSAVLVVKDANAAVFFFDANDCYLTAVTGTVDNIKKLLGETVGISS